MRANLTVKALAASLGAVVLAACGNGTIEANTAPTVLLASSTTTPPETPTTAAEPVAEAAGRTARLVVTGPQYDAPGARVPIIVTLYDGPAKLAATALDATTGSGGRIEECGESWRNPQDRSLSRLCHLVLPTTLGKVPLTGRANWRTPSGEKQSLRSETKSIEAKGVRSSAVGVAEAAAIARCGNTTDLVWLTFDDAIPSLEVAKAMLATLERNKARGRFFLNRIEPRVRTLLEKAGHVVTNHTRDHLALTDLSNAEIAKQIETGPATTPGNARLVRPPYGAGSWSTRVVEAITASGHTTCRWTVDTRDWTGRPAAEMGAAVRWGDLATPPVHAGGNVLMHATVFSDAKLQAVIDAVKARGLVIEPIPGRG
ncbi:MAG: polysaccharide deacetylase family protein [Sporichthyaceae bacterium]